MSEINPYTDLVNSMINLSLDSIGSQETVASLNDSETDANQALCADWTTGLTNNSTESSAYSDLENILNQDTNGASHPNQMQNWIQQWLGSGNNVTDFSSSFMTLVYSTYMKNESSNQDTNSTSLALISSCGNLIASAAQADEQPGQNAISTLNTLSQHFQTDQGPLSSATTTILDGVNNYSSAMQSISA